MNIRLERPSDHDAIRAVNDRAFEQPDEGKLVDALRENGALTLSLVAEVDEKVVGHIAFSPVTVYGRAQPAGYGLGPVAVDPDYQGQGIGTALIKAGIEKIGEKGAAFIVLLGHTSYYPRFGFTPASGFGLDNEYGVDDAFMALELVPGALDDVSGLIQYRPEFAEVS